MKPTNKKMYYERTEGRKLLTVCPHTGELIGGGYCLLKCTHYFGKNMAEQYVICNKHPRRLMNDEFHIKKREKMQIKRAKQKQQ